MIPQMIKNGYPRLFAVNVTISGSLQPLLVPPSHNMIIYSIAAGGNDLGGPPVHGRHHSSPVAGTIAHHPRSHHRYRNDFPKGDVVPLRQALKIAVDAIWGMVTIGSSWAAFFQASSRQRRQGRLRSSTRSS